PAGLAAPGDAVLLPPEPLLDDVPGREPGEIRPDDLPDHRAGHDLAHLHGARVGAGLRHPTPHVPVQREVEAADEHRAGPRLGDGRLDEPEVARPRETDGARREEDLAVPAPGHDGSLDSFPFTPQCVFSTSWKTMWTWSAVVLPIFTIASVMALT